MSAADVPAHARYRLNYTHDVRDHAPFYYSRKDRTTAFAERLGLHARFDVDEDEDDEAGAGAADVLANPHVKAERTGSGRGSSGTPRVRMRLTASSELARGVALPASFQLEHAADLPIWDQGRAGSCTAHAVCTALYSLNFAAWSSARFNPSRLYVYNTTRQFAQGSLLDDSGAYVFDACATAERARVAAAAAFSNDVSVNLTVAPPLAAVRSAAATPWNASFDYLLLFADGPTTAADVGVVKSALVNGSAVVIGFVVYDAAMAAVDIAPYVLKRPSRGDTLAGGHCVCIVGYDDERDCGTDGLGAFRVHNSWYETMPYVPWADNGCFWMSYAYAKALTYDFYACGAL